MAVRVWVTSDHHFGHANILGFVWGDPPVPIRPGFADVREMDATMIARWNDVVRPEDHVYQLGDFAMNGMALDRVAPQLHGIKRLVRGNHDKESTNRYIRAGFREIYGSRILGQLLMTHYPVHPGSIGRHNANVHGHIHQNPSPPGRYINVSVEVTNYTPVLLDELVERGKDVMRLHKERGIYDSPEESRNLPQ